jgi:HTH-type transcriptional regulator/antitoxin HigA
MEATFNNFAEPPGVYIEEELEARGWLQADLAYILGVPPQSVNQIIRGKRGINADLAKALAKAFDTSAELFLNLQKAWELEQAREPDPGIAKRSSIQSEYPLREMIKRGWIKDGEPEILESEVASFFGKKSIDELIDLPHAAKRIGSKVETSPAQQAWLHRVVQVAKGIAVPSYSAKKLKEAVKQMTHLRLEPEQIRDVPRLLNECGVRLVIVEKLPGSKIDGVCTWLNNSSPVIGMTLLNDRIDNFWFVLRHEIAHVLHKHGQKTAIIDLETNQEEQNLNEEECLANEEAGNFCVDQEEIQKFYLRKKPYFSERDIVGFALRMGVHPGIVVGQIQRRINDFRFLKKHQVGIREFILSSTIYDGWGHIVPIEN